MADIKTHTHVFVCCKKGLEVVVVATSCKLLI